MFGFRRFYEEASRGILVYHGSRTDKLKNIRAGSPPYAGGIGHGVYVGVELATAQYYGKHVYELQANFGWDSVLGVGSDGNHVDNYLPIEWGNSILVGESVEPFQFQVKNKWYAVVDGTGWVDERNSIVQEYGDKLGEPISMEQIGEVVEEAGYKAVYVVGIRGRATVNEELLVFNENNLKLLRQIS